MLNNSYGKGSTERVFLDLVRLALLDHARGKGLAQVGEIDVPLDGGRARGRGRAGRELAGDHRHAVDSAPVLHLPRMLFQLDRRNRVEALAPRGIDITGIQIADELLRRRARGTATVR